MGDRGEEEESSTEDWRASLFSNKEWNVSWDCGMSGRVVKSEEKEKKCGGGGGTWN